MKFIFIILFVLALPFVASAALRAPGGSVPSTTPLQPIPQGTGVDYSGNVEQTSPDFQLPQDNSGQEQTVDKGAQASKEAARQSEFELKGLGSKTKVVLGLIFVLLGCIVAWKVFRKNAKK